MPDSAAMFVSAAFRTRESAMLSQRILLGTLLFLLVAIGCDKAHRENDAPPSAAAPSQLPAFSDNKSSSADLSADPQLVTTPESVDLPADWQVGEKLQYKMIKSRERIRSGETILSSNSTTDVEVEVLEQSSAGFVVGWTLAKPTLSGNRASDPTVQHILELVSGVTMRLVIDSDISIVGIQNWEDVQRKSHELIEILAKRTEESLGDAAAAGVRQTAAMFATEQQVTAMCAREAQMFFFALGGSFSLEPTEYQDRLPNPFGGEAFPSKAAFRLLGFQPNENVAVVEWTQDLEPAATQRIMEKIVRDMTSRMGAEAPDQEILKDFSINDEAIFRVDLETGWLESMKHRRSSRSGVTTQADSLELRRVR